MNNNNDMKCSNDNSLIIEADSNKIRINLCLLLLVNGIVLWTLIGHELFSVVIQTCTIATVGYISTFLLIPGMAEKLRLRGLRGFDLGKYHFRWRQEIFREEDLIKRKCKQCVIPKEIKKRDEEEEDKIKSGILNDNKNKNNYPSTVATTASHKIFLPESVGLVPATVFILCTLVSQFRFTNDKDKLLEFTAGIFSILFITFLGFADDVLDLKWRHKVTLPFFGCLPLLAAYHGPTTVLVPNPLKSTVSHFLNFQTDSQSGLLIWDLGPFYYLFMALLSTFCSNAINIYAGLNGLEVGQSIIICIGIIMHNLIELSPYLNTPGDAFHEAYASRHLFSLTLSIPFLATSLALFAFNQYPAKVFIGDTYTCFAGVYFAVTAILGHFSKTLLLFFLPQVFNFLYSCPQLFGFVPCPRHRLPFFDRFSNRMFSNGSLTFINLLLDVFGPMNEKSLVRILLCIQSVCCILALCIRYSSIWGVIFI